MNARFDGGMAVSMRDFIGCFQRGSHSRRNMTRKDGADAVISV
jgi:hypothetical protein